MNEGEVVLDIIHRLQATQAPDLAVRWNCKAGKCGSCSAEINGRPRLMCMTRMSVFDRDETITVTPMRAFPVVRDLVTDVSFNYAKAREVPGLRAAGRGSGPASTGCSRRTWTARRSSASASSASCARTPAMWSATTRRTRPAFAGPRFLMRVAELDMHPLDAAAEEPAWTARRTAQDEHGLGYCNITKCCTEVCPEHIKITDNALIPLKERAVDRKYDPLVWLGNKIRRRRTLRDRVRAEPHRSDGAQPERDVLRRGSAEQFQDRLGRVGLAEPREDLLDAVAGGTRRPCR